MVKFHLTEGVGNLDALKSYARGMTFHAIIKNALIRLQMGGFASKCAAVSGSADGVYFLF